MQYLQCILVAIAAIGAGNDFAIYAQAKYVVGDFIMVGDGHCLRFELLHARCRLHFVIVLLVKQEHQIFRNLR